MRMGVNRRDITVPVPAVSSGTKAVPDDADAVSADTERDEAILPLLLHGWSFRKIHRFLGGNRNELHERVKQLRDLSDVDA